MASTSQANGNDLASQQTQQQQQQQHPQQQHQPDSDSSRLGNSAQNLAVVASAAGYTADNHLAGLVEAATAAAGQDVDWSAQTEGGESMAADAAGAAARHARGMQNHLDGYGVGMNLEDEFGNSANGDQAHHLAAMASGTGDVAAGAGAGRAQMGRHTPDASLGLTEKRNNEGVNGPPTRKRRRMNPNVDPAMTTAGSSQFHSSADMNGESGEKVGENGSGSAINNDELRIRQVDVTQLTPQQAMSDARAAGVHSAVALFRQPSSTGKKHTRPPMSKMFTSLELSPENFLHLQAAAKAYMLDDNHPERRDCVGQRGKGDMEMVKLRLWNCVRDFLDREGNGLRFFGEHVVNEGVGQRSIIWPRDEQKIISLVMPLLRRMVTNERQRQYAIETRKGGGADEKKRKQNAPEEPSHATPEQRPTFNQPPSIFNPDMELTMNDLLTEGYPTDAESIARTYGTYNQDYQLDNLGAISGLSENEWCGLVRAVDCHYQMVHNGNAAECDASCEECNITHIVSSDSVVQANWRIGGGQDDLLARNYFATGVTHDISRIIRDNLTNHSSSQQQQTDFPSPADALPRPAVNETYQQTKLPSTSDIAPAITEQPPTNIRINLLQTGQNKRMLPRLDLPANQCPDFPTLLNKVHQYYQNHHQHQIPPLRLRAWLEEGLVPVQNDGEWMVALLAVSTAEWMDGELRIVVDTVGEQET